MAKSGWKRFTFSAETSIFTVKSKTYIGLLRDLDLEIFSSPDTLLMKKDFNILYFDRFDFEADRVKAWLWSSLDLIIHLTAESNKHDKSFWKSSGINLYS